MHGVDVDAGETGTELLDVQIELLELLLVVQGVEVGDTHSEVLEDVVQGVVIGGGGGGGVYGDAELLDVVQGVDVGEV